MEPPRQQDGDWVLVPKAQTLSKQPKKGTETSYLLARMGREMQTPLNAIIGLSQMLAEDSKLSTVQQEMISNILESANTFQTMYHDFRDYAVMKMSSARHCAKIEFNFHQHIFGALRRAMFVIRRQNLELDLIYDFEGHTPSTVTGDYECLNEAIVKVVSTVMSSTKTRCYCKVTVSGAPEENEPSSTTIDYPIVAKFAITPYPLSSEDSTEVCRSMDFLCERLEKCSSNVDGLIEANLSIFFRRVLTMGGDVWMETPGDGEDRMKTISFTVPLLSRLPQVSNPLQQIAYDNFVFHDVLVVDQGVTGLSDQVKKVFGDLESRWKVVQTDAGCNVREFRRPLFGWDCVIAENVDTVKRLKEDEEFKNVPFVVMSPSPLPLSIIASAVDHGVSMCMTVPSNPTEIARAVVLSLSSKKPPKIPKLRILVAEDNFVNQRVIQKILEKCGQHATIAGDGAVAVELFKKQNFDIVFMDHCMPVMSGSEAVKTILAYEKQNNLRHTPIVMMTTGFPFSGDIDKLKREGCDDYVPKPFRPTHVYDVIRRCARVLI